MTNLKDPALAGTGRRRVRFSPREQSVLHLVGKSQIKKVIAAELSISESMVKYEMEHLYAVTGIERGYMSHAHLGQFARDNAEAIERGDCEVPDLPKAA